VKENLSFREIDASLQKVNRRKVREKKKREREQRGEGRRRKGERKRKRGRKKTREEGAGQSYYKNPQNNRRGSH